MVYNDEAAGSLIRSLSLTTVGVGSGKRKVNLIPTRAVTSIPGSASTSRTMTSRASDRRLRLHRVTVWLVFVVVARL